MSLGQDRWFFRRPSIWSGFGIASGARVRWSELLADEKGTQSIEVLLVVTAVLVPCFAAILLLQAVLFEYIEVETIILTSPFF